MGFPSPAADYVQPRLSPEFLCNVGVESRVLETDVGFAIVEPAARTKPGDVLLILYDGHTQFAKLLGGALMTNDGEAIEGAGLEGVEVLGHVTFFINKTTVDDCPI